MEWFIVRMGHCNISSGQDYMGHWTGPRERFHAGFYDGVRMYSNEAVTQ